MIFWTKGFPIFLWFFAIFSGKESKKGSAGASRAARGILLKSGLRQTPRRCAPGTVQRFGQRCVSELCYFCGLSKIVTLPLKIVKNPLKTLKLPIKKDIGASANLKIQTKNKLFLIFWKKMTNHTPLTRIEIYKQLIKFKNNYHNES